MNRQVFERRVQARHRTSRISLAAPGDFSLRGGRLAPGHGPAFPYCFDLFSYRALYVRGGDPRAVQDAPFYYLHLRRTAERIVSVPLEHGPLTQGPRFADPVFLFSPGRVGSTLISRVLAEAGVPSVSEPDFYSQAARVPFGGAGLRQPLQRALWAMGQDLSAALGAAPVIKLRAECAKAPHLFLRSPDSTLPQSKSIVLFRGFDSWARSTAQTFGAGPHKAVAKYMTALRCYQTLARGGQCHLMRYEDWVKTPEAAAAALGQFLGLRLAPEAVRRALSRHSQEGTPLVNGPRPGWEEKWHAALALWATPKLAAAREKLGMASVWD